MGSTGVHSSTGMSLSLGECAQGKWGDGMVKGRQGRAASILSPACAWAEVCAFSINGSVLINGVQEA